LKKEAMMKIPGMSFALLCAAPGLLSCSSSALAPPQPMRVEPLLQVTHSNNTALGLYQLGRYYQGQNRLELAEQAYRKALALKVDFVDAHSALGTVYARQGKFEEAINEFNSVLEIAPQLAQIYNNLGYTHYLQGKYEAAIAAFDKATLLEPGNARTFNNLGAAYEKLGNDGKARSAYARAAELSTPMPQPETVSEIARADERQSLPAPATSPAVHLTPASQGRAVELPVAASGQQLAIDPAVMPPSQSELHVGASRDEAAMVASGKPFRFQITNGNGTPALAKRFRDALMSGGLPKSRLANLKPYQQKQTVVLYREGFRDEALRVSAYFAKAPSTIRDAAQLDSATDVRLVLGHDAVTQAALRQPLPDGNARLAQQ
jgi:tetratricopeptide (TPR) repeat protein